MIRRPTLAVALALGFLAAPLAAEAQAGNILRIGFLIDIVAGHVLAVAAPGVREVLGGLGDLRRRVPGHCARGPADRRPDPRRHALADGAALGGGRRAHPARRSLRRRVGGSGAATAGDDRDRPRSRRPAANRSAGRGGWRPPHRAPLRGAAPHRRAHGPLRRGEHVVAPLAGHARSDHRGQHQAPIDGGGGAGRGTGRGRPAGQHHDRAVRPARRRAVVPGLGRLHRARAGARGGAGYARDARGSRQRDRRRRARGGRRPRAPRAAPAPRRPRSCSAACSWRSTCST